MKYLVIFDGSFKMQSFHYRAGSPAPHIIREPVNCAYKSLSLSFRPYHSIETLEAALQEVETIPAYLPNCLQLQDVIAKAKKWLHEAEALQVINIPA